MDFVLRERNYLPHQWAFLRSEAQVKALVSGFGGGKTHAFLRETLLNHIFRRNAHNKSNGWILYPTYDLAEELFIMPFIDLLAAHRIEARRVKWRIYTRYGVIRVYQMQTPQRMVGSELTFIGFDEFDTLPYDKAMKAWSLALGRLRGCEDPHLYIVTTPEGFGAVHQLFVEEAAEHPERALIRARTEDNPFLPDGYVERLRDSYDARLIDQYLNGQFVNLNGAAAYYAFDRKQHVQERPELHALHDLVVGMDFNVDPMTATVCAHTPEGGLHVIDEIYLHNSNTDRMCAVLLDTYPNRDIVVCPDMTGDRRTAASAGHTDISILKRNGFRVEGVANPRVKDRLNTVNNALDKGLLTIDPRCVHLIRDLEQVVRDAHGELDKSDSKLTHISDALGYAVYRNLPIRRLQWSA